MIRDITLGQYYPVQSPIHRLDPRTKLTITFFYLISLFLADNKYMYLLAIVAYIKDISLVTDFEGDTGICITFCSAEHVLYAGRCIY